MNNSLKSPSQFARLIYFLLYIAFLFFINELAFGQILPLANNKGLWFYSGALLLILGSLLVTPYFTSPANAISYLTGALVAVLLTNITSKEIIDILPKYFVIGYCVLLLAICFLNILLKDSRYRILSNISAACRILADNFGNPRFVYSIILVFSLWEFHRNSPTELLFIGIAGIVIVSQQPFETIGSTIITTINVWRSKNIPQVVGSMVAYQMPGIILIKQNDDSIILPGTLLLIADKYSPFKICVALGQFGRDEGVLIRGLEIQISKGNTEQFSKLVRKFSKNEVVPIDETEIEQLKSVIPIIGQLSSFVGIVVPDTNIEHLYFEVIQENEIEQGRIVQVSVGDRQVIYQVLDGLTKEEIVYQKNTFGFARGEATQIGIWDVDKQKFSICNWIPQINSPVFIKTIEKPVDNVNAIGHFPDSNYCVELKNIDQLVTHNTAILGILGVGKSMLSIELVERMIHHGIKVVCIDLTNQYASELSEFYDLDEEASCLKIIQDAGEQDIDSFSDDPEKGGSVHHLRDAISNDLENFLKNDKKKIKIYNPTSFSATKQEQEPKSYSEAGKWFRAAGLWQVTPVEITCMISEICLSLLQDTMTDKARVCLVFEEAHSLIPEWNFVAVDSDKRAASGTARAILQGRKYGLGCILVTQRTANVSKTILNQCNTIFAMRSFDETGKDFLSNYIGEKFARKLSTLQERQAIFFGRASSCENPVLIRLNDQKDFRRVFREGKIK